MKKQRIAFVIGCVLTGSVFFGYETRAGHRILLHQDRKKHVQMRR